MYTVQVYHPLLGWNDTDYDFDSLEDAIKYIEEEEHGNNYYRVIKIVCTYEMKCHQVIHGFSKTTTKKVKT